MKRILLATIAGLLLLLPLTAAGDEARSYDESQKRYLRTAEEYRGKAEELRAEKEQFDGRRQSIVGELVDVYSDLTEIKVGLADAIGDRNWAREEKLEKTYYALKEREERLREELEETRG